MHASHNSKGVRLALLLSACGLAWSNVAMAQDDADIVVTASRATAATKTDTPLVEVPQSISVISDQEFRDRAAVDFQDIYRYSAGVAAAGNIDSRGDFISARGFDAEQYIDGLKRMPAFVYGARLEIFTLERAEVLRGPSSVLYGAGGAGATLNGISKTPKFDLGGEAGVVFGTDDRLQAQADVYGGFSDTIAGRLVVLGRDGKTQWGTPDDRILINPSLLFKPGPDTEITLIGLYQNDKNSSLGYVPLSKSLLAPNEAERVDFNFFQGEPDFNRMNTEFTTGSLLITHRFSPAVTFNSRTRYTYMDTDYREVYGDFSDGESPFADAAETLLKREYYVNRERSKVLNTDNNLSLRFDTGPLTHTVLLGIDYTWFSQTKDEGFSCDDWQGFFGCYNGPSPAPINIYDPQYGTPFGFEYTNFLEYRNSQLGLYVQDQISFQDKVHVLLGLRRDKATATRNGVDETDQVAWSFRGGIIAELGAGISPYFSYSESFLPVPGGDFFGNPFQPQIARQYEGGVKWEPALGTLVSVSVFDIEQSNYVSQDPTNIQNFIQGGSVGSQGFEFEANVRLPENLNLIASYSYTDAKVLTSSQYLNAGDRIASLPKHMASIWAVKTFDLSNDLSMRAGAGVRYVGDRMGSSQMFLTPSVTLVDAMVSAEYKDWLISLNASNLFNTQYYGVCDLSSPPYGYCSAAKDRTLMGSITRKF